MHNPEFSKGENLSEDETGFSEKQLDIDAEIQAGEWQSLRKFKTFQRRSRQGKIIATYQAVSNRINQLVPLYYKLVNQDHAQCLKLLDQIKHLRLMQEILLNCLIWEPKGQLDKGKVPPDVWKLIE